MTKDKISENNSETQTNGRDPQTGRFLTGNNGGGRKVGSRNRLAEDFIADLHEEWQRVGADCIRKFSATDPAGFCRLIGNVLPKELDVSVQTDTDSDLFKRVADFRQAYQIARQYLTGEPLELEHHGVESDDEEPRD